MFWYKMGRATAYLLNLTVLAYVLWDGYNKIVSSESIVINIIAISLFSLYNMLVGRLTTMSNYLEFLSSSLLVEQLKEQQRKQEVEAFEKLLNDFGDSDWKLE